MKSIFPLILGLTSFAFGLHAQSITPEFADSYSITSFSNPHGGIAGAPLWLTGSNDNLISASATSQSAAVLYFARLQRDPVSSHFTGYDDGSPSFPFAPAPYIDGGLTFFPGLATDGGYVYSTTQGSIGVTQHNETTALPVSQFNGGGGALTLTPSGLGRSDNLTLIANGGMFITGTLSGDTLETLALSVTDTGINLVEHPEGVAYVTSPVRHIDEPSLLVLDAGISGTLSVFTLDGAGLPIASSKRDIATGIPDAFGLTVDTVTGDVLVSGNNSSTIYEIRGFTSVPEPYFGSVVALVLLGSALGWRKFAASTQLSSTK